MKKVLVLLLTVVSLNSCLVGKYMCNYALMPEEHGNDFMVVHGVSMGAATTMMLSGDDLPPYYRAFVEDCGYSSVWDQFAHNLKDSFHLPTFPVLNSASIVRKNRYGWSFKDASSTDQLAKCERPDALHPRR